MSMLATLLSVRLPISFLLVSVWATLSLYSISIIATLLGILLIAFTVLDIKSRYNEFKRISKLLKTASTGRMEDILWRSIHSACQRDACRAAFREHGMLFDCNLFFKNMNIKWYSLFKEVFNIKRYFSIIFWRTFFVRAR